MIFKSRFPDLEIPQTDVLSYLFPPGAKLEDEPIWKDAEDPKKTVTPASLYSWLRRLGSGLERGGFLPGDVVLVCSPNHLFVPVAYLGIIGYGAIFSGINPTYTVQGMLAAEFGFGKLIVS
jgi:acyl-CoA synthetase (AMP-forming)/AMP-acid ligase II